MSKIKLSVVIATKNEENNIEKCLDSVKKITSEIIVYDEFSTDKTREVAKHYGAKVFKWKHKNNFHETKQRAINKAAGDWILQLDADERVNKTLTKEIKRVLALDLNIGRHPELVSGSIIAPGIPKRVRNDREVARKLKLSRRHQQLIEQREGSLGKNTGEIVAFFIPRVNYFLGKPLKHAGKYPDGVIRLIKRGKARLPAKSVHELMEVEGEVGWLFSDLEHHEYPTLECYLERMNRYTDIKAREFTENKIPANPFFLIYYSFFKPFFVFINLYFRHKGVLDGMHGFIWCILSALHFPIAYFKYWQNINA